MRLAAIHQNEIHLSRALSMSKWWIKWMQNSASPAATGWAMNKLEPCGIGVASSRHPSRVNQPLSAQLSQWPTTKCSTITKIWLITTTKAMERRTVGLLRIWTADLCKTCWTRCSLNHQLKDVWESSVLTRTRCSCSGSWWELLRTTLAQPDTISLSKLWDFGEPGSFRRKVPIWRWFDSSE